MWRVHRHIGMGGDQFVAAVAGEEVEERLGDRLRREHARQFADLRPECAPLAGARELCADLRARGHAVVLASSATQDDLDYFVDLVHIRNVVDANTGVPLFATTIPQPTSPLLVA